MRHPYRFGLTGPEMKMLRSIRGKGFALALIPPADVGNQLNRKTIEDSMIKAAKEMIREIKEEHEGVYIR
jgi:hypothetical protein